MGVFRDSVQNGKHAPPEKPSPAPASSLCSVSMLVVLTPGRVLESPGQHLKNFFGCFGSLLLRAGFL